MTCHPCHQGDAPGDPRQGAREAAAHHYASEVRRLMGLGAAGERKALTPHSRQEFERRLANEPGHRITLEDLCYYLGAADDRDVEALQEVFRRARRELADVPRALTAGRS